MSSREPHREADLEARSAENAETREARFETVARALENDGRSLMASWIREWGDALVGIANADTKYPSMPTGFTGDWTVLRSEARTVLDEDADGVWT